MKLVFRRPAHGEGLAAIQHPAPVHAPVNGVGQVRDVADRENRRAAVSTPHSRMVVSMGETSE